MDRDWYRVENEQELITPSLLIYPERIRENIQRAISMAGSPARLRPHVKTHKMPEVVRMHLQEGITRFKCATIAEAEMTASIGAEDILLATQPVGPNVGRFMQLISKFPPTRFSVICDNLKIAQELDAAAGGHGIQLPVYLDIDCGLGRTGITPGPEALDLYRQIELLPNLVAAGIHVYDGQIHEPDPTIREQMTRSAWEPVEQFCLQIEKLGLELRNVIAGGTPTFPFHAKRGGCECSPGTYVFWDFGYQEFKDLDFLVAAVLVTRIISKPAPNRLCLDLGHKAVASENPPPRVEFLNLNGSVPVMHNEEHLVIETRDAGRWSVGDLLYAVPRHICPTVALHDFAFVVRDSIARDQWVTSGRHRFISI